MKKYFLALAPLLILPFLVQAQTASEPSCTASEEEVTDYFGFEECSPLIVNGEFQMTPTIQSITSGFQCSQRNVARYDKHQAWLCGKCGFPCGSGPFSNSSNTGTAPKTGTTGSSGGTNTTSANSSSYYTALNKLTNTIFKTATSMNANQSGNYATSFPDPLTNALYTSALITQKRIQDLTALATAIQQFASSTSSGSSSKARTATVNILRLNVRNGPTTASPVVTTLSLGQQVVITNVVSGEVVNGEGNWYQISIGGNYIWAGGVTSN